MDLFNFSSLASQLFWLGLFFLVQYYILSRLVLPKIDNIFKQRSGHIDHEIQLAEELTQKANALKASYEQELEQAKASSLVKTDQAIFELKKHSEKQLAKLDELLAKDNLKQELRLQKFCFSVEQELETITLSAAGLMLEKITGNQIKSAELKKYLEQLPS